MEKNDPLLVVQEAIIAPVEVEVVLEKKKPSEVIIKQNWFEPDDLGNFQEMWNKNNKNKPAKHSLMGITDNIEVYLSKNKFKFNKGFGNDIVITAKNLFKAIKKDSTLDFYNFLRNINSRLNTKDICILYYALGGSDNLLFLTGSILKNDFSVDICEYFINKANLPYHTFWKTGNSWVLLELNGITSILEGDINFVRIKTIECVDLFTDLIFDTSTLCEQVKSKYWENKQEKIDMIENLAEMLTSGVSMEILQTNFSIFSEDAEMEGAIFDFIDLIHEKKKDLQILKET